MFTSAKTLLPYCAPIKGTSGTSVKLPLPSLLYKSATFALTASAPTTSRSLSPSLSKSPAETEPVCIGDIGVARIVKLPFPLFLYKVFTSILFEVFPVTKTSRKPSPSKSSRTTELLKTPGAVKPLWAAVSSVKLPLPSFLYNSVMP
ncbi:hypothetical protein D9M69_621270 [compost metagenome]